MTTQLPDWIDELADPRERESVIFARAARITTRTYALMLTELLPGITVLAGQPMYKGKVLDLPERCGGETQTAQLGHCVQLVLDALDKAGLLIHEVEEIDSFEELCALLC